MLLARRACERVVVLAMETIAECADLFARGRWLIRRPLVEAAVAVLLTRDGGEEVDPVRVVTPFLRTVPRRAACAPLIALARAGADGQNRSRDREGG